MHMYIEHFAGPVYQLIWVFPLFAFFSLFPISIFTLAMFERKKSGKNITIKLGKQTGIVILVLLIIGAMYPPILIVELFYLLPLSLLFYTISKYKNESIQKEFWLSFSVVCQALYLITVGLTGYLVLQEGWQNFF